MLKYHFLLVSAALLFQIPVANAQIFEAVVVSVGDGDTIRVKSNTKNLTVRLGCIDAPEKKQNPWGVLATKRLKQLLRVGSKISLRSIGTDRYNVLQVYEVHQKIPVNPLPFSLSLSASVASAITWERDVRQDRVRVYLIYLQSAV